MLLRKGGVREGKVEKSEMLRVVGEEEGAGKRVGGRDHMWEGEIICKACGRERLYIVWEGEMMCGLWEGEMICERVAELYHERIAELR